MRTKLALAALLVVGLGATSAVAAPAKTSAGNEVGPAHTSATYDPTMGCTGDGPVAAQGWCNYYDGALTGRSGQPVELAAVVCRLPGQDPYPLQVVSGLEAEFCVSPLDDTTPFWTWSRGHRFSDYGTTFSLSAGSCLRWHVTWSGTDAAGRPLAPGTYHLMARPYAHQAGSIQAQAFLNEIYFTVTQ
jgi:hypothetical protein